MRKLITAHGCEVDLDDPATYIKMSQDIWEVRNELYRCIGYSRLHLLGHKFSEQRQIENVDKIIREIADGFGSKFHELPLQWWQEKLFILENETENLC